MGAPAGTAWGDSGEPVGGVWAVLDQGGDRQAVTGQGFAHDEGFAGEGPVRAQLTRHPEGGSDLCGATSTSNSSSRTVGASGMGALWQVLGWETEALEATNRLGLAAQELDGPAQRLDAIRAYDLLVPALGDHLDPQLEDYVDDRPDARGLSLIHISEPTRRTPISYAVFC